MQNYVKVDRKLRRVIIRGQGQWTPHQADQWYSDIAAIHAWTRESTAPITIFSNLTGLVLHTQEISRRVEESVVLMRDLPIARYALIVPSFLMRMQCRRLLMDIPHTNFDDVEVARQWLGWEPTYAMLLAA
ncbi:hypothetical protein Q4F19_20115 [Sphingomonas sp. BIUV-7]|uniref:STAS/SEC14 domain-containing protein n=1 Tax=Sphingomonas natans TaxID=3063330 RepID=A0ABT8YEA5_9SPHN|nr:hypothetical protein [Sphingomonas sp. BIUV-7]MDO6416701.1 hypothetical protein [Sphingomonas sp. BIUV-7]